MNSSQNNLAEDKTALEFTPNNSGSNSTEWLEQIRSKDFNAALLKLDALLNTNNSSLLERLWWIRCQLNLNLLPASTLTSPLEEIFPNALQNSDCAGLAITTFYKAGKSLSEKNQSRLSLLMLERASSVSEKYSILSAELKNELQQAHHNAIETEIKNAQLKKESITYISELEAKLAKIKKSPEKKVAEKKKSEWTNNSESTQLPEKTADETPILNSNNRFNYRPYIIALILLLAGYFVFTSKYRAPDDQLAISLPLPNLEPINPMLTFETKKSVLSGVEQRIASLGKASSESSALSSSSSDGVDSQALEDANKIDVPTPTEEEELESISGTTPGEEQIPQAKIPRLDPKTIGASKVDTVDQSPRRAGIEPSLPDILNNEPRIPEGKTLDGKVLQSYEVEQFNPPLRYSTIAATEVLSAPSLLSKSLARLETDTHVDVTKKMGLWLEIRSTGGRIGYIYAQDAEETK